MNAQLQSMLQQAIQAFEGGNLNSADLILKRVLQVDSKNLPALHILGLIKASQGSYREAADFLGRAARIHPNDASIQYNLAKALSDCGLDKESMPHHKKTVQLAPDNPEAWLNYGKTASNLGRHDDALYCYDKALSLNPNYAQAVLNKGATFKELGRYEEAIGLAEQAMALNPNLAEGWVNKGIALKQLKRYDDAIACYDKALSLKPDHHEGWVNKGVALYELKRYEEAIVSYDKALNLKPDYPEAWSNKGLTLHELKRYEEAIVSYDKALSLKSDINWVYGELIHIKMKICQWASLADSLDSLFQKVMANEKVSQPFSLLALSDDPLLHRHAAEIFAQAKYPFNAALGPLLDRPKRDKIRIAYFSPDFREHPVSFLTAELFEVHDRNRFEVYAFSLLRAPAGDLMSSRIKKAFDRFIDAEDLSDQEVAQVARELEIDIAIDLSGPTHYSRTGLFSYRAAPIQVNWLGYPGTIGADFMDYIVADSTIIPKSHEHFYVEKVVAMPDSYMVDDSSRVASSRVFTKKECGLPEDVFVFCCFNNDYKFNPHVLNSWSIILERVPKSVLWISENNQSFKENLQDQFGLRGIEPQRIVFSKRLELLEDHLARYRLADLFLDTYPYNAHTTAVDSLKAGVPVLTMMGNSFASRVAASLLNAIDVPELITDSQEEYEALAIELARNPQKLASIKQKLADNRLTTPLFDTPIFAKNLEAAYIQMYEQHQADLST